MDYSSPRMAMLIKAKGWASLPEYDRIGAIYGYVRDEIKFGYNIEDAIPASHVLNEGYGQCNTKAILLMALLRGSGISCRLHGFTIHKNLQRGVVPPMVFLITPENIVHSWVEITQNGEWLNLEGFILDRPYLQNLQASFAGLNQLSGYGAGTRRLQAPDIGWAGKSTYTQNTAINQDFGVFATPDDFYQNHRQNFSSAKGWLFRNAIRHWMNAQVEQIRNGRQPAPLSTFDYIANTNAARL